jgi:hypothetical protein
MCLAAAIPPATAAAADPASQAAAAQADGKSSAPIPFSELGAKATADCKGEGTGIEVTPDGARLHTDFQKLSGKVTTEGLWLESTEDGGGRLRIIASGIRRADLIVPLASKGQVSVTGSTVASTRPGLTEEYSGAWMACGRILSWRSARAELAGWRSIWH